MISIVIPTYNEEKYLENCLLSLADQDYKGDYEIIIADSSTDKTREIAKKYGAKIISLPRSTPAIARQAGFAASSGQIIATLDADNIVPPNWLSQIDKEFKQDPNLVCLFGFIKPLEKKLVDELLLILFNWVNILSFHFLNKLVLTGANEAIKRDTFVRIGGCLPLNLPEAHCDIFDQSDLLFRLRKEGKIKFSSRMKLFFSMRRFHHFGYFQVFLTGFKTWWSLHFSSRGRKYNLRYPRENRRRTLLGLEQTFFLTAIIFFVCFAFAAFLIFGPFAYLVTHFFAQPRAIVLKRVAVAVIVIAILLLPASLFVWSTTSWAKENESWRQFKAKLTALRIDQKFKNIADFEVLDKLNSFELQKLIPKADH